MKKLSATELKDDRLTWGRAPGEWCGRNLTLLKCSRWGKNKLLAHKEHKHSYHFLHLFA